VANLRNSATLICYLVAIACTGINRGYNEGQVTPLARLRQVAVSYFWAIFFWMSFALMMAWEDRVTTLQYGGRPNFLRSLLVESAACLTFALLTPPIFFIVRRNPVTSQNRIKRSVVYLLGAVPFIAAFSLLRWLILPSWSIAQQEFVPRTFHTLLLIPTHFADQTWTYLATLAAAHAYAYLQERLELLQAVATSELQALKSQIHPHFLFNTLHGVSVLVDQDKNKAKAMIVMLSNLLRTALKSGQTDLIQLHEELHFVEDYLAIEKVRLGERLEVRWEVASETRGLLVPQLILQPLVENAIVHGIACCREGGWIQLSSRKNGSSLEIQISNSMCGQSSQGMGVGLRNIKGRLQYLYDHEARFEFTTHDSQFATATLTLPALPSSQQATVRTDLEHTTVEGRSAGIDR
jgi:two-component system LytT family sensor kinase